MSSTPSSTTKNDDLNWRDVHCSVAQTSNLLYSRNYDQTRPFREQNLHGRFAFFLEDHFVYAVLTGFDDQNASTVRYYTAVLQMVISDKIQNQRQQQSASLDCEQREQFYTKLLKDAFATVEEQFRHSKSEKLSEKAVFDIELHGNNPEHYPTINDRLKELAHELSSGLSAVVALIHGGRIYVANIGDTRAILARKVVTDSGQDCIRAISLSTTHDLNNPNEIRRLNQLGINTEVLKQNHEIGNMSLTRCLGNLWLKSFYKDFPDLATASQDPILDEPEVASMALDHSCLFLILTSASLIETLREALNNKSDVTEDLIRMTYDEFQSEEEREFVSQSVVNEVSELHQNCFASSSKTYSRPTCRQIDDLTLLIRDLTVAIDQPPPTDELLGLESPLGQLKISIDDEDGRFAHLSVNAHTSLQDTLHTPIDTDRTITDRPLGVSRSQNNLVEDSGGHPNYDDDEIDAYVDFKELLEAYNEVPVPTN